MKKTVLGLVAVALLAGCGSSGGAKEESKTCTIDMAGMEIAAIMKAKDDKIKSTTVEVTMPSSLAGGEDLSEITKDQQAVLEDSVLSSLGIEESEGIEISSKFSKEEMKVAVAIDLEKSSKDALDTLGFGDVKDTSLKDFVKVAEESNFTCK